MSLKVKIALGVLAATAVMSVALGLLTMQAKDALDAAEQRREAMTQGHFDQLDRAYREQLARAAQYVLIGSLEALAGTPISALPDRLREEISGIEETAIIGPPDNGELPLQVVLPEGSQMTLTDEEVQVVQKVYESGTPEFLGEVLFYPYDPRYVLRLKLRIPRLQFDPPQRVEGPSLGPFVVAAFTTLGLAMLAVFVLLMFALRRFVLAPLGNVLEDSKRIVKGAEGLEVQGFKGGGNDIETLVAAFNAMFAELKAYQSDLEGKVNSATRTIERQQQSLVIAQRLAATGTLAAGLAHEVNNPLSGMLNAARRLRKREGLDERSLDYIALIEEGLQRIEQLMRQILDFARRRDMKPERFNAEAAIRRALQLVRHRLDHKEIRLEEDIRQDLPALYGNEEEISQVLMNLLINASDASERGGAVRITLEPTGESGVRISVEDSGDGVPAELRSRIFDPFFTTKDPGKGTGLGLSIVHTIIDNHGGTIRVEDGQRLGGARFVVDLPSAEVSESKRRRKPTGA
jgi:signal transduction histidine kinase